MEWNETERGGGAAWAEWSQGLNVQADDGKANKSSTASEAVARLGEGKGEGEREGDAKHI